jgi:hypothetical protein
MEISEVVKQLKHAIERSRRAAADRRERARTGAVAYDQFLERIATPLFKQVANALRVEGLSFQVFTPAGGLRLASDRAAEDFIELALDVSGDRPTVLGRVSRSKGSRVLSHEAPIGSDPAVHRTLRGRFSNERLYRQTARMIPATTNDTRL